jgi:hypothetical protein
MREMANITRKRFLTSDQEPVRYAGGNESESASAASGLKGGTSAVDPFEDSGSSVTLHLASAPSGSGSDPGPSSRSKTETPEDSEEDLEEDRDVLRRPKPDFGFGGTPPKKPKLSISSMKKPRTRTDFGSASTYEFPVRAQDVEKLRTWMQEDNAEMESIRNDPYYRFAIQVAEACRSRTPTWFVRNEYREYMKHHGRLQSSPLVHGTRLADLVRTVLPSADVIYDPSMKTELDDETAAISEHTRRLLLQTVQFMFERQQSLRAIQELGHQGGMGYRNRQLLTLELDAMAESALEILRGMAGPGQTWNSITVDDLILSDSARPIFAQLIALEKFRAEGNNASKPVLEAHYARIMHQRNQAIQKLLKMDLRPRYGMYTMGLTRAGNPIPLVEV